MRLEKAVFSPIRASYSSHRLSQMNEEEYIYMSKGFNKILDFMRLKDSEFEDDDFEEDEFEDLEVDDEDDVEEIEPASSKTTGRKKKKAFFRSRKSDKKATGTENRTASDDFRDDIDDDDLEEEEPEERSFASYGTGRERKQSSSRDNKRRGNIYPLHGSARSYGRNEEVCVVKPVDFESSQEICDILMSDRTAIINFEDVTTEEAQRITDFVTGTCYCIQGDYKQISANIFVAAPHDVDLTGDFQLKEGDLSVPNFDLPQDDD